jgi:hypothetical protein
VTDNKSPGDRLLELVVFGPTGLAVTLVEEFPKFVEKGRHRVEGQVHTARLVGQFAVQMGRRQLEQSLAHFGSEPAEEPQHAPHDPLSHDDDRSATALRTDVAAPTPARAAQPAEHERADAVVDDNGGDEVDGAVPATPGRPSVWLGGGDLNGSVASTTLAIPGYDSLSASQVVQRLEGLSSPELEEVRAHEAAHRQRRTILHRVEQLLAGGAGSAP